jgi:hypothetical protein
MRSMFVDLLRLLKGLSISERYTYHDVYVSIVSQLDECRICRSLRVRSAATMQAPIFGQFLQ